MERRDLYDREGHLLGKTAGNHDRILPGEYRMHAIVILRTRDGRFILQKRTDHMRYFPGMWDVTGGGVSAGETSDVSAIRESMEELGVTVKREDMVPLLREINLWDDGSGQITETWLADVDLPEGGFHIDPDEVADVKVVNGEEFVETVCYNKTPYFRAMLERIVRNERRLYVLAGYDGETEAALSAYQQNLYDCGFCGTHTHDIPMHITLGSFDLSARDEAERLLAKAAEQKAFPAALSHIGIFPDGRVLFAAPDVNRELLALREVFGDSFGWTPHTTMLIDEPEAVRRAIEPLTATFRPLTGKVTKLYLYEFWPTKLIKTVNLQ